MGSPGSATVPLLSALIVSIGLLGFFIKSRKKKEPEERQLNAFVEEFEVQGASNPLPPLAPLPLSGLKFAVKDLFDVEGHVTGFGNPAWRATHETAKSTAPAVAALLKEGAKLVGKTHMDELAFSINGENKHYGTPLNSAAPDRVPGGSSSGSAAAVAAGVVDFALGTDTAGSVRIPAAYTGIFSFRPSHGRVSAEGVVPMSPSLDAVGWFARDASLLRTVGGVLLSNLQTPPKRLQRVIFAEDLMALSTSPRDPVLAAVTGTLAKTNPAIRMERAKIGEFLASRIPSLREFTKDGNADVSGDEALLGFREAMRVLQGWEFKQAHEAWLTSAKPELAPDVAGRVSAALGVGEDAAQKALQVRRELRATLDALLTSDTVLVFPPSPGAPPKRNSPPKTLDDLRHRAMQLVAVASLSGLPQVTIPMGTANGKPDGPPLSFSILGAHGSDEMLLSTAVDLARGVTKVAEMYFKRSQLPPSGGRGAPAPAPGRAEEAKNKGNEALKAKRFGEAVKHYNDAIRLDKTNATYFSNKALALLSLGRNGDSENACTEALKLEPKNVKALLRRGAARENLGAYEQAVEDFEQALVLEPGNVQAKTAIKRMKDVGVVS